MSAACIYLCLVSGVSRAGFRCFFSFVFSGLVARVCLSFNLVLGLGKKDLLQLTLSILWGKSTRSMYLGLVIYLSIYIRSCKSMTFIIHLIKINIKITRNSSKQD